MADAVIRAEKLSVRYEGDGVQVDALKDASFQIGEGEFIVVLGPSGSGKSTLLNVIGGMAQATSGNFWYRGEQITCYSKNRLADYRRKEIGFVFQFFNLIPSLTVTENVALAAELVKDPMDPEAVLGMVGLHGLGQRFPSQLSGGQQQRVSIARAIVKKPRLLLCDEPTGALDSVNSLAIVDLLLEVGKKFGCPVMTITHNGEMARVADRVFHMKDGRIETVTVNENPCRVQELDW